MKRLITGVGLGTACFAALALWQHSLSRRLAKVDATLDRIADRLDVSGRDDEPPRFDYQVTMARGLSKDEFRAIMREELLAVQGTVPTTAPHEGAPTKVRASSPSPESVHAFQSAQRLVQNAVSSRAWSEKDATELRQLRHQLTADQFQSILSTFIPAINSQQVHVEFAGPLF